MRISHGSNWNMARNPEKREKNKFSLKDLEYGQKSEKTMKMRHTHCQTWNMARILTNEENENLTWQELEYGEKH